MTIREAMASGVGAVRKPQWNEEARLELPARRPDGTHGPWCRLFDPPAAPDGPIGLSLADADDGEADWEPFTGARR